MFRQFLKLRQARKAFRDGHYKDALQLSEDPDIAQHLKAVALRRASLDALERQAKDLEDRGELTLAVAEVKELATHEVTQETRERERELVDRKKDRDEMEGRLRSRLFRAKLDLGRGDLMAARQVIDAIDPANRTAEMNELLREVDERLKSAADLLAKAKKVCAKDPAEAEGILLEAEKQHPKAEGLVGAFRDLAHSRLKHLISAKVGDPAILSFLMEWSLFKRRHLDGINCDLEADEKKLRAFVADRAMQRLGDGELENADRLIERLRESIGLDDSLEKVEVAVSRLSGAREKLLVGDFDGAEADLSEARSRINKRVSLISTMEKELKTKRKEITPAYAAAEESLKRGDLPDAKNRLLDVLDKLPGHRGSLRLLEIANEKQLKRAQTMAEARSLIGKRRLDAARRTLEDLFADGGDTHEISILMKEIEVLEKSKPERPEAAPWAGELPVVPVTMRPGQPGTDVAGNGPVGVSWLLSVEEHGEHLVFEADTVVFGNAVAQSADVMVLANLGSRHANIVRRTSFHGGVAFKIEPLADKDVFINGKKSSGHNLVSGDEVRLGRDFRFRFRQPSERSKAAILEIISGHDVAGAKNVVLMPPVGRAGCIRIGPYDDAHIAAYGSDGEVEIYRDSSTPTSDLVVESVQGVEVDGDESRAKAKVYNHSRAAAGDLVIHVRNLPETS